MSRHVQMTFYLPCDDPPPTRKLPAPGDSTGANSPGENQPEIEPEST
jgi:hypothetical protein